MFKRFVLFLAFTICAAHVVGIYLMPNCTYCPPSKNKTHILSYSKKQTPDTSSEIPYKVKYRTLLCFNAAKKLSVTLTAPLSLPVSCLTFTLKEFLFCFFAKTFHFNLTYLRVSPALIIGYCSFLI
ncbi:MAG TPA: hypothetical protein VN026_15610 [Bacteroidia bacterium]|jgi:hypothetical protein|nr:hypothetical protein [Bacteroidia bacterium]